MLLFQLSFDKYATIFSQYSPFVVKILPRKKIIADYWKSWTGKDESESEITEVIAFSRDFSNRYNSVNSISDCQAQEKSFYFNKAEQAIYVHFEHSVSWWNSVSTYGIFYGYSRNKLVNVDGIEYLPLIKNDPKISAVQDFYGYKSLNFSNSTIELDNTGGDLDKLIDFNVYGNICKLYSLDDSKVSNETATMTDAIPIATYFIEDYSLSQESMEIRLQDMRKLLTATVPANVFTVADYPNIDDSGKGKPIPFLYGQVREIPAICTNSKVTSGNVEYRAAEFLSSFGTVQVLVNDVWVTKTPVLTVPSTGAITLSSADGRNSSGAPLKCKLVNPIGLSITYASDIIKDINERFCGIPFTASNYDLTEWAAEQVKLATSTMPGILFNKAVKTYDAIKEVQNGAITGFRYEFNSQGQRTIRCDDYSKAPIATIENIEMINPNSLEVNSDTSFVFAESQVQYSRSYVDNSFVSVLDRTRYQDTLIKFKQIIRNDPETILSSETDAATRAAAESEKYFDVRPIVPLKLIGRNFFNLRIYDNIIAEITGGFANLDDGTIQGRKFYGIKKCQIIAITPDDKTGTIEISAVIIGDYVPENNTFIGTSSGDLLVRTDFGYIVPSK